MLASSCSDDATEAPPADAGAPPDATPPAGCAYGELALPGGECRPAGVPPDACASGFETDGAFGCNPILPDGACGDGEMAVPGDTRCRPVGVCADGTWGGIATDASTEHVDAAYTGGASDGTVTKPWTTIQDAIDAAPSGGLVAIAAGTYAEDLHVVGKPVRVHGRCAGLVEIAGTGAAPEAIRVETTADGTEIADVAVTGPAAGVSAFGATRVMLDRVWIHDLGGAGVNARGKSDMTIAHSLIDRAGGDAVVVATASSATVDATVIRATVAIQAAAVGVFVTSGGTGGPRPSVTVRGSVVEQTDGVGLFVEGADATVEATVIRDALHTNFGWAIAAQDDSTTGARATFTLRGSVVERCRDAGIVLGGSDLGIETSVVRGTLPGASGMEGKGIAVQAGEKDGSPSNLVIRASLLADNHTAGCLVTGSNVDIEGLRIRDTRPQEADGWFGRGLDVAGDPDTRARSSLLLVASLIEHSHEIGVRVDASDATIDNVAVRDTRVREQDGKFGRGVQIEGTVLNPARVTLRHALVESSHEAGVSVVDAEATIEDVLIRGTLANELGGFGDGVVAARIFAPTSVTISGCRVEGTARAGVATFGAAIRIGGTTLECNPIHLDGETGPIEGEAFDLDDLGGNVCGCAGAVEPCAVLTSSLEAPPPLSQQ